MSNNVGTHALYAIPNDELKNFGNRSVNVRLNFVFDSKDDLNTKWRNMCNPERNRNCFLVSERSWVAVSSINSRKGWPRIMEVISGSPLRVKCKNGFEIKQENLPKAQGEENPPC